MIQEWTYLNDLNANYTFKYRQKNARGTNTVLQMHLPAPKANSDLLVLEKAMKSNLLKMFRFRLILVSNTNLLSPNLVP